MQILLKCYQILVRDVQHLTNLQNLRFLYKLVRFL